MIYYVIETSTNKILAKSNDESLEEINNKDMEQGTFIISTPS